MHTQYHRRRLSKVIHLSFVGWMPPHHCHLPDGRFMNDTIPVVGEVADSCEMYTNITIDNSTMTCSDGWHYIKEPSETTIVTEVCTKNEQNYELFLRRNSISEPASVQQVTSNGCYLV